MQRIRRGYVDGIDGQVHYRASTPPGRPDAPALVLLHQSPSSSITYAAALPYLGDRLRAYAVDTPGYGQSDPPDRPLTISQYADRIVAFVDAVGLDRCSLLGNHTGGSIAVDLAARHPDRVERIILGGFPLYDSIEREERKGKYAPPIPWDAAGGHLRWAWDRYRNMMGPNSPTARVQRSMLQMLIAGDRYNWAYEAVWDYDPIPALRQIKQPVLLLAGAGDVLAPMNTAFIKLVPQAIDATIANAGNSLPDDLPELYAQKIVEFVESQ